MKIIIDNLTKKIGKNTVLDNINLTMTGGKIYGLWGKNGSGKTMLMRAISGLIEPTNGKIIINNKILGKDMSFPDSIGILLENPSFINEFTGFRNLKALAGIQNKINDNQIRETLKKVGLEPNDKKIYRKYSLGMKQRLGIAAAIMEEPNIILLDEPINAIDSYGVDQIKRVILSLVSENRIIIIACHDRSELENLSDIIYNVEDGKVLIGE